MTNAGMFLEVANSSNKRNKSMDSLAGLTDRKEPYERSGE